jgi:hypothetical protein
MKQKDNPDGRRRKQYWWQWGRYTPALQAASSRLERVLMHSFYSSHLAFAFIPSNTVVAGPHNVFPLNEFASFCVLQSRIHELWARFFGSSLEDRLRYATSDCFETFAFPLNYAVNENLAQAGERYYEYRSELMISRAEGLTMIYNRMNDPEEMSPDIQRLRDLHDLMDRAVLDAYSWIDIQPKCTFIDEFDDEDEEEENSRPRKKKYRYRWPDEIRDEVLARLLELNRQRAVEEGQLLAETADAIPSNGKGKNRSGRKKKRVPNAVAASAAPLFTGETGDD